MQHGGKTNCDKCGVEFRKTSYRVRETYDRSKSRILYYCPNCYNRLARRLSAEAHRPKSSGCLKSFFGLGCLKLFCVVGIIGGIGSLIENFPREATHDVPHSGQVESFPQITPSQEKDLPIQSFGKGGLSGFKSHPKDKTNSKTPPGNKQKKWIGRGFGKGGLSGFKPRSKDKTINENPDEKDAPKPSPPPTQIKPSTDEQ